jgi:aspartate-semialdehyde dehydrogenase
MSGSTDYPPGQTKNLAPGDAIMSDKVKTAVLGATGLVGQVFVQRLADHPWFDLSALISSSRQNQLYGEGVRWLLPGPMPAKVRDLCLESLDIDRLLAKNIRIIFSSLPADVALETEATLRARGFQVFSNARAHRYHPAVPILMPEVNPDDLQLIEEQGYPENGFIITNANCTTTGLVLALAPLRKFGIREVYVSTYQSLSGAGFPGPSALAMTGNLIPHIEGEAAKLQRETGKILGAAFPVFAHCVRVPVPFGHLETVWVRLDASVSAGDIRRCWESFTAGSIRLPSLSGMPLVYDDSPEAPQPAHTFAGDPPGMSVRLGGLEIRDHHVGFRLLVNNLVRGAAGGSVANAEFFLSRHGGRI